MSVAGKPRMQRGTSLQLRGSSRIARFALAAVVPAIAIAAALGATSKGAHAADDAQDKAEANERCAVRLSIALVGKSADPASLSSANPQGAVDAMVGSPDFAERWSRFINSAFNGGPAATAMEDPVYYMAKYIVTNNRPWTEMFTGAYSVTATATAMEVKADPAGIGYFTSPAWMKRYAGNEDSGLMLSGAFRQIQNTTGIELIPSVGQPGDDRTVTGRMNMPCKTCHFDAWYALDKFAHLMPVRKGQGDTMTFAAPVSNSEQLLGKTLTDRKSMLAALVDSDAFRFNQCRQVFQFLYGRNENQCESKVFDACVDALSNTKTIQSAVAAVAKDPSFCQ
jgi:hypothetical protein